MIGSYTLNLTLSDARRVSRNPISCCNQTWVLKKYVNGMFSRRGVWHSRGFLLSVLLRSSCENRGCRLAEEPHQSLEILGRLLPSRTALERTSSGVSVGDAVRPDS